MVHRLRGRSGLPAAEGGRKERRDRLGSRGPRTTCQNDAFMIKSLCRPTSARHRRRFPLKGRTSPPPAAPHLHEVAPQKFFLFIFQVSLACCTADTMAMISLSVFETNPASYPTTISDLKAARSVFNVVHRPCI